VDGKIRLGNVFVCGEVKWVLNIHVKKRTSVPLPAEEGGKDKEKSVT
jgi:hypothetical protein